jgi:hypothetical protein
MILDLFKPAGWSATAAYSSVVFSTIDGRGTSWFRVISAQN